MAPTARNRGWPSSILGRLLKNAICGVPLSLHRYSVYSSTPLADSPTRRRGKKSLLIRRDATPKISGALHLGIFDQPEKNRVFRQALEQYPESLLIRGGNSLFP